MRNPLTASTRRAISLAAITLAPAACVLALGAPSAGGLAPGGVWHGVIAPSDGQLADATPHEALLGAPAQRRGAVVPDIINGQESSIAQFPWQVFVATLVELGGGNVLELDCGGSILDATHILTAAHCVDHENSTETYPASDMRVIAGASNVAEFEAHLIAPAGSQEVHVARVRVHPYYSPLPNIKDDAAVLELAAPLELSAAASAQPIPLVATAATPAPGAALSLSGYGKENGAEEALPNGKLYSTSLTAISSDACRNLDGANSAVILCAYGTSSAGCQGDSGGPLTEGSPPVEVGMVDFGEKGCPTDSAAGFTNLAAPEVRAFIEGSESPPVAARQTSPAVLRGLASPVDFSPLTCEPGSWSGSPSFTYTFQTDDAAATVLQSGPSTVYAPSTSVVGHPVVCVVQASNPGGVSTTRTGTTPPITADSAAPVDAISALKCHLRTCTLSVAAADPNRTPIGVEPWVSYEVTSRCPGRHRHGHGGKPAKQPLCHRTSALILPVNGVTGQIYQVTASGLPYNETITFNAVATNAAGLRARPVFRSTTLHPPHAAKKPVRRTGHGHSKHGHSKH